MICSKCGSTNLSEPECIGFSVIHECLECYNVEVVEEEDEEDMQ